MYNLEFFFSYQHTFKTNNAYEVSTNENMNKQLGLFLNDVNGHSFNLSCTWRMFGAEIVEKIFTSFHIFNYLM